MKYLMIASMALWSLLNSVTACGEPLKEYHLDTPDLQTFSAQGITARLCNTCEPVFIPAYTTLTLQEYGAPIDLKRASELYLRKSAAVIFIGVTRDSRKLAYVNFGGHASDLY